MRSFRSPDRCCLSVGFVSAVVFMVCQYPLTLQAEWQVVSNAQSRATIVIPKDGGRTLHFAARELQKYVKQMTDVELPIADKGDPVPGYRVTLVSAANTGPKVQIRVQELVPSDDAFDAFRLKTLDDQLVITGVSDRAVLYGIYALLERWGCRWMGPGEDDVPRLKTLVLDDTDFYDRPAFRWRGLELIAGSSRSVVDWMAKARLNVAWPEQYVPNADLSVSDPAMLAEAVPDMLDRGMTIFWGGHILPQLFSIETYKDHPDYFAQIKGRRLDTSIELPVRGQLCTSNPDVLPLLAQNTVRFLREHPWIDVMFLWGNDTIHWCECDACRALEAVPDRPSSFSGLDRSATYCRMIQAVCNHVRKELPGRRIGFNHYYNNEDLPRDADGRVRVEVLPSPEGTLSAVDVYRQCDRHAFGDAHCPSGKGIAPLARLWRPHYDEAISWSYYWSLNFMKGLPISMVHKIPDDFRLLQSLGIQGMVDNVSLPPGNLHWMNNRLNFHIYARAAWDPRFDVDAEVSEYVRRYYGPAAPEMKRFWKLMEVCTQGFGIESQLVPDDPALRTPSAIHGWLPGIRGLVPNELVYRDATKMLSDALAQVADAKGQPSKVEYKFFVFRIRALQSVIESWSKDSRDYKVFGFLNGGGVHNQHLYNKLHRLEESISCSVVAGNNVGDCFWANSPGEPLLSVNGNTAKVIARVNYGVEVSGEPAYRSGPGLYQAHDQGTACGLQGAYSATFFLGNLDDETSGPRRVILQVHDGQFGTALYSSADSVWNFGQEVALRIVCVSPDSKQHTYSYQFNTGGDWSELAKVSYSVPLSHVAPMHHWAGRDYGRKARFPLLDWAVVREFSFGSQPPIK